MLHTGVENASFCLLHTWTNLVYPFTLRVTTNLVYLFTLRDYKEERYSRVPRLNHRSPSSKHRLKEATRTLNRALKQETENAQLQYIKTENTRRMTPYLLKSYVPFKSNSQGSTL